MGKATQNKVHRPYISKCVAQAIKDYLKSEVAGNKHVLIIDESTDVASQKHLCVVIAYLSDMGVIVLVCINRVCP